jgi:hypothetical protein
MGENGRFSFGKIGLSCFLSLPDTVETLFSTGAEVSLVRLEGTVRSTLGRELALRWIIRDGHIEIVFYPGNTMM